MISTDLHHETPIFGNDMPPSKRPLWWIQATEDRRDNPQPTTRNEAPCEGLSLDPFEDEDDRDDPPEPVEDDESDREDI